MGWDAMSPDEIFVLIVCVALSLVLWGRWLWRGIALFRPGRRRAPDRAVNVTLLAGLAAVYAVLRLFASHDVRDSPTYLLFYMVMAAAWLALMSLLLPLVNLLPRDDVQERANPAAASTMGAALVAFALCFAGSNIGDGPGWWVVVFCAALASAALLVLWWIVARCTRVMDAITIGRDPAAAGRLSGLLIGCGAILGRAAAGNWTGTEDAVRDFLNLGWPASVLAATGLAVELVLPPREQAPDAAPGLAALPAFALYVAAGATVVLLEGWWT